MNEPPVEPPTPPPRESGSLLERAGTLLGRSGPLLSLNLVAGLPTLAMLLARPAVLAVDGHSDEIAFCLPAVREMARQVRSGELPLWNGTQLFGMPCLSDPNQRLLYLPMLPHLVFAEPFAHHLVTLFHVLLLATGTFLWLRQEGCSRLASWLGGAMMALGFKVAANEVVGWESILYGVAWIPLLLLLFRRCLGAPTWRTTALLALVVTQECLSGQPHFLMGLALGLPMAIVPLLLIRRSTRRLRRLVRAPLLAYLLGVTVAAPQLAAALNLSARSDRDDVSVYGTAVDAPLLPRLLFPDFLMEDSRWENGNYLGLAALSLAVAGAASRWRRSPFGLTLLGAFLLLSAGTNTPVGRAMAQLPLFRHLSYPSRFLWIATMALVLLAAQGLDAVRRARTFRERTVMTLSLGAGSLLVLAALPAGARYALAPLAQRTPEVAWLVPPFVAGLLLLPLLPAWPRPSRRWLVLGLVAATALELLGLTRLVLVRVPFDELDARTAIDDELERDPEARFVAWSDDDIWKDTVVAYHENLRTDRADGYNPLHSRQVMRYLEAIEGLPNQLWTPHPWLRAVVRPDILAIGVTHVVGRKKLEGLGEPILEETRRVLPPSGRWVTGPTYLYAVPGALPRTFLAPRAQSVRADDQLDLMRSRPFDGRRTLLVDGEVPPELAGTSEGLVPVEVLERRSGRIRIRARAPEQGGFVVRLDAWAPEWSATVDGADAKLLVCDSLFRAVRVGPGTHEVVMTVGFPRNFIRNSVPALLVALFLMMTLVRGAPPWPLKSAAWLG